MCVIEDGWTCTDASCMAICGDGLLKNTLEATVTLDIVSIVTLLHASHETITTDGLTGVSTACPPVFNFTLGTATITIQLITVVTLLIASLDRVSTFSPADWTITIPSRF